MKLQVRDVPPRSAWALEQAGIHPLLARLYAARGVQQPDELDDALGKLLPPEQLLGANAAARLLADALTQHQRLCIVADYDCDGATACAVAVRGLRMLGAQNVRFLVPDRVVDGYGLTPPIAQRVQTLGADVLITVDNGIASVQGVAAAQALGLKVLVTDQHLPGPELPTAEVIVNPNQPGCGFESKALAGVRGPAAAGVRMRCACMLFACCVAIAFFFFFCGRFSFEGGRGLLRPMRAHWHPGASTQTRKDP